MELNRNYQISIAGFVTNERLGWVHLTFVALTLNPSPSLGEGL